jgi:hypothetical protein
MRTPSAQEPFSGPTCILPIHIEYPYLLRMVCTFQQSTPLHTYEMYRPDLQCHNSEVPYTLRASLQRDTTLACYSASMKKTRAIKLRINQNILQAYAKSSLRGPWDAQHEASPTTLFITASRFKATPR